MTLKPSGIPFNQLLRVKLLRVIVLLMESNSPPAHQTHSEMLLNLLKPANPTFKHINQNKKEPT